ncbi:MAG TPA: EAL domain-containing protein [Pyrinomonadaceae bacterium]|nr:EAL domain-containing protein [Pyrinomonadaceae bacterium]
MNVQTEIKNTFNPVAPSIGCSNCSEKVSLDFDFSMAFQPIVDFEKQNVFAQEALCRGLNNEPAGEILGRLTPENLYKFDQMCRVKAVTLASKLGFDAFVSINFMPNAVYNPENCLRTTLRAAAENNFPVSRIIFEITEVEQVQNDNLLKNIVVEYKRQGLKTAIDDFGSGYSGLNLLSIFQPDIIKLDMELIRDIDRHFVKQTIVKNTVQICRDLGITVIAEGIETKNELNVLRDFGLNLFQGYYFAKPAFESVAEISPDVFSN